MERNRFTIDLKKKEDIFADILFFYVLRIVMQYFAANQITIKYDVFDREHFIEYVLFHYKPSSSFDGRPEMPTQPSPPH